MNDNQKEIKYIDLFAGVGGFHKGLQQANDFEETQSQRNKESWTNSSNTNRKPRTQRRSKPTFSCVWANEWDKHACTIYKKQFPNTPLYEGDIRLVKANDIPEADLLVGGFPCQPFSLAGKRKGFEETRGTLFYEILRIARDKRIKFLLLENVKGLLSAQDGQAFGKILTSLDELGYNLQWQVLNSKNFGVPQNRERVFIIGCLGKKRFKQIFPLGESNERNNEQNRNRQVSASIQASYKKGVNNQNQLIEMIKNTPQGSRVYSTDGISSTLASGAGGLGAKTGLYAVGCAMRSYPRTKNPEQDKKDGRFQNLELRKDNVSNTVSSVEKDFMVAANRKIRRLTPTECERLQGFPDGWTSGLSDTQRYKCMGNAVTTNVITAIGKKMLEVDLFG